MSVKTVAPQKTTTNLLIPNQSSIIPQEKTSGLFDHPKIQACVELNRQFLKSISALLTWASLPRAVLKIVILFTAAYDSTP